MMKDLKSWNINLQGQKLLREVLKN
jgi:hypothetical protein